MSENQPAAAKPQRAAYTVREVCEILGIQKSAAYVAVQRGDIPSVRIGGAIRIPIVAVERMLDTSR